MMNATATSPSGPTDTSLPDHGTMSSEYRRAAWTMCYMSVCLTCVVWQIINASILVHRSRKLLHIGVLTETVLSFCSIGCSVLNPLTDLSCEFRYWVSIVAVNMGGAVVQTILLYKAYICYDRAKWLIFLGSAINLGYLALTFLYATIGRVPTFKDYTGSCVLNNLEWPAIAKLGLDILSNAFLSVAFLLVIYRHYRMFNNNLHKSLLSGGVLFSVGVIASNIITGILIATRTMGGLSADLYSFDWVITGYLLIKQFKFDHHRAEKEDDIISKTMAQSERGSRASYDSRQDRVHPLQGTEQLWACPQCNQVIMKH
ncbi:hypothetical protein BCR43DRAFT_133461 [Syncephalastrum racemosum]|uniref:Uncharacterized protein n=1 Tax=Syncephalastrum racemosum TaxID=13706 RepID=A0A1X2HLB8_SYNRA|nr:hypothetical protein BCR43DRAFT_133461 [Syncephalastrum racemosum]